MESFDLISPEDLSKMLGVSLATVYRYMKRKNNPLPHYRITNKNYRISINHVTEWMESRIVR